MYRAALLRKRILISCHAPVRQTCNFGESLVPLLAPPMTKLRDLHHRLPVYNLSILANIPLSILDLLEPGAPPHRFRPLFTVGVHDIPFLVDEANQRRSADNLPTLASHGADQGWTACTTDSILAVKDTLWDMLITLPAPHTAQLPTRSWPTIESPRGVQVRATQRDLRRYRALRAGLARFGKSRDPPASPRPSTGQASRGTPGAAAVRSRTNGGTQSAAVASSSSRPPPSPSSARHRHSWALNLDGSGGADEASPPPIADVTEHDADQITEPQSWAALAYSGFMWWATAGEQGRTDESGEAVRDAALLAGLDGRGIPSMLPPNYPQPSLYPGGLFGSAGMHASLGSLAAVGVGRTAAAVGSAGGEPGAEDSLEDGSGNGDGARTGRGVGAQQQDGQADEEEADDGARIELAIIAYFHRLTAWMLGSIADAVSGDSEDDDSDSERPYTDEEDEDEDAENHRLLRQSRGGGGGLVGGGPVGRRARAVRIDHDVLARMGLDPWSSTDAAFVCQASEKYFARRAYVEGKAVEICGVKVC